MNRRKAETIPPPRGVLDPEILYSGDNGRLHCGAMRCAGHTAWATGRGLGGCRVIAVDPDFVREWIRLVDQSPACETCGRVATGIAGPTGASLTRERQS